MKQPVRVDSPCTVPYRVVERGRGHLVAEDAVPVLRCTGTGVVRMSLFRRECHEPAAAAAETSTPSDAKRKPKGDNDGSRRNRRRNKRRQRGCGIDSVNKRRRDAIFAIWQKNVWAWAWEAWPLSF
jgi:hypothetical protein